MIKEIIKRILRRHKKVKLDLSKESISIDFGASSIKYNIIKDSKSITGSFLSTVRKAEPTELIGQPNAICVNNVWYIVGESRTSVSSKVIKVDKEYLEILAIYCLVREGLGSGIYNINTILPFNQLNTIDKLKHRVNSDYRIIDSNGKELEYKLNVANVKVEGYTSYFYYKTPKDLCTVIINIGHSTTDVAVFTQNEYEKPITFDIGTNLLYTLFPNKLASPSTSVFTNKLRLGEEISKEQLNENYNAVEPILKGLVDDIVNILRFLPSNSKIILCGGGSIYFGNKIKELLKNTIGFNNVIIPNANDAIYSDVLGLSLYLNSTRNNIHENSLTEDENITEDIENNDLKQITQDSNLYQDIKQKIVNMSNGVLISAKTFDITAYEWRKFRTQLLEDGLICVTGTNTYKK